MEPARRLYRHPRGPLAGVATGLADYFGVDPALMRLLWLLALLSGFGLPAYLVCWVAIPRAGIWPPEGSAERRAPGEAASPVTPGLIVVALACTLALMLAGHDAVYLVLPAAMIGLGVYLLNQRAQGEPRSASDAPPSAADPRGVEMVVGSAPAQGSVVTPVVLSLLALGAGVCWALDTAGVSDLSISSVAAGGVVLIGAGLLGSLWLGRAPGLIPLGLALAALTLVASKVERWSEHSHVVITSSARHPEPYRGFHATSFSIGDNVQRPLSLDELLSEYSLGIGDLTLDLSRIDLGGTARDVAVNLGVGEAIVIVPANASVEARGEVSVGEVSALGRQQEGVGASVTAREEGAGGMLRIHVKVGIGNATVRRAR